jgi:hypothetical protein
LSGEDFRARLNLEDCTTVDMLAARWTQEQSLLDVYLHSLTDADLAGMVRDADDDADQAFNWVVGVLQKYNEQDSDIPDLPIPINIGVFEVDHFTLGVLTMPTQGEGVLETVMWEVLGEYEPLKCLDQYLLCLAGVGQLNNHMLRKGKIEMLLNDIQGRLQDTPKQKHDDLYQLHQWNWKHSALDDTRTFLTTLAAEAPR